MINSLHLIIISCLVFFLGYIFYRKRLFCLWEVDSKNKVPAFYKYDGIDYVPAKNWLVLFGHHFSSIAGAGPIIGPVIACFIWGWVPAIMWVVLGTVFIGGIHDFSSLIVSVKEEGSSISEISKNSISFKAKVMFSLFVWMALILVIAVFAFLCAKTFISE
ncbi:MAG: carbon starvation protein A, partial [Candidatus Omnitrophica bacterium]|nr:carbon starvation protein A [Candidatus Omnitrophota bacterium]